MFFLLITLSVLHVADAFLHQAYCDKNNTRPLDCLVNNFRVIHHKCVLLSIHA